MAPVALIVTLAVANLPIGVASLNFFYVILAVGLAVPGTIAQIWRTKSPVDSNRHSKEWKFIGVWAVVFMAFVTGFQLTPHTFLADVFGGLETARSLACLQQLGVAIFVFALLRTLAVLTLVFFPHNLGKAEAQDAYILLVNPNFFLWAALLIGAVNTNPNGEALRYAGLWGALGFFLIPVIEQIILMNQFGSDLLRQTLRSSIVATEDIKKLFEKVDVNGNKKLDQEEIIELLGMIEDQTIGERTSLENRSYISDYMFRVLDSDKSGSVDLQELENYISTYGLVANLNVE